MFFSVIKPQFQFLILLLRSLSIRTNKNLQSFVYLRSFVYIYSSVELLNQVLCSLIYYILLDTQTLFNVLFWLADYTMHLNLVFQVHFLYFIKHLLNISESQRFIPKFVQTRKHFFTNLMPFLVSFTPVAYFIFWEIQPFDSQKNLCQCANIWFSGHQNCYWQSLMT